MNIRQERKAFKPFVYNWAADYWMAEQNSHWLHTEINMDKDVKDWDEKLSEAEKYTIGTILKGFTQTEVEVGNYWSELVPNWFPVPEIQAMAQTFGAFETIHAFAYSYLNDTLGLDDFEAFLEDEATMNKLEALMGINNDANYKDFTDAQVATSVAIFSAAAEGIQLFSSFAVLMSFKQYNLLTGISKQMIFSVRDESLHSEAGCRLVRTMFEEDPALKAKVQNSIYDGIDMALKAEYNYIDHIFAMGDLTTIKVSQLKTFMADRANRKLKELTLEPRYEVDEEELKEMSWFYHIISSEIQTDFFYDRESSYSKANPDWHNKKLAFSLIHKN